MCPHQPEGQTENLAAKLQELAKKPPADQPNHDPISNSGYPAGGASTRPQRDAYEKPAEDADSESEKPKAGPGS